MMHLKIIGSIWYVIAFKPIKISGQREKSEWHLPKENSKIDDEKLFLEEN